MISKHSARFGALLIVLTSAYGVQIAASGIHENAPNVIAKTAQTQGWLRWRGPLQSGVSFETNLPDAIEASDVRWTLDMRGRGAPVMANGRVFSLAYEGEGPDLQEVIICLDEKTGERLWAHRFSDFLSDVIYNRYAVTSPSIDPETGNVYCLTTPGLLLCFTTDGELRWQKSMAESLGGPPGVDVQTRTP